MVIYAYRDGVFSRSVHPTDPSIAGSTVNIAYTVITPYIIEKR